MAGKEVVASAAGRRILFAHQSVGGNVLDGVKQLSSDTGAVVQVVEGRGVVGAGPGIVHFKVGRNEDPLGKIVEFKQVVQEGGAEGFDTAMLKLCYLDFSSQVDAEVVADEYVRTLKSLQEAYPATRFVAVTAPLTTIQTGPKAWIKKILGRQPAGYEGNVRRAQFNSKVRASFGKGALFDIARLESSGAGRSVGFSLEGRHVEAMDPSLTSDGGHLNDFGSRLIASEMLRFVAGHQ